MWSYFFSPVVWHLWTNLFISVSYICEIIPYWLIDYINIFMYCHLDSSSWMNSCICNVSAHLVRAWWMQHYLIHTKPICVPKLSPSLTWEKNSSGRQEVQRVDSDWCGILMSSMCSGLIPPLASRILKVKARLAG